MTIKGGPYLLMVPIGRYAEIHEPGTAFVAKPLEEMFLVHYEAPGQASNIVTFEDRIRHAAGRLDESYPTSKMMGGGPDQWKQGGTVKYVSNLGWLIDDITDEESLYGWDPGPHYAGGSPALHEEARIKQINEDIRNGRIPAPWK